MTNFETIKKSIKDKRLIDPKIVDQMSMNEMIEHLLRYSILGEIWIPEVYRANNTR